MRIYLTHSKRFDYKKELYEPIKQSYLNDIHDFVLPHESSDKFFDSQQYIRDKCDLVIAEVSYDSIGLGIEICQADVYQVPVTCIYKEGKSVANSLTKIGDMFEQYSNDLELISGIDKIIDLIEQTINH